MRSCVSIRCDILSRYFTALLLFLHLQFPLNTYSIQYSVNEPAFNHRRRGIEPEITPNYSRTGGMGAEDEGVAILSVGSKKNLHSNYNAPEVRESGRPCEYSPRDKMASHAGYMRPLAKVKSQPTKTQRELLLEELFSNYKTEERPTEMLRTQTVVKVHMKVLAIYSVDASTMDYYMDAWFRQTWVDPRLAWNTTEGFKNYTQPLTSMRLKVMMWLPDLFFRNGKDGYVHKMTLPNYLLRIYPDGGVLYSQKITMRFACQMDLHAYPMDTQTCEINMGSLAYTLSELKLVWREMIPVEGWQKLQIPQFYTPTHFAALDCNSAISTTTASYTCLTVTFSFKRQLGSYLLTIYIPNILIVMVSFLSFWISVDAAAARVSVGLLSLLALLTQASYMATSLPRASYIKALDVWFLFSVVFVMCVVVEYALAITLLRRKRAASGRIDVCRTVKVEVEQQPPAYQTGHSDVGCSDGPGRPSDNEVKSCLGINTEHTNAKKTSKGGRGLTQSKVDSYSRIVFPLFYVVFNIFYWLHYLVIVNQAEEPN
ncbi:unnamed protein product [Dibothriocephalus latus]|uniref:Uncharacterized protein n=1 Tax=Dibothriocephalus latus TaxID=60516 RepID=A0A3P6TQ21_DIBLA|nr:unnamed protein product [Dibothriocephalus latus]